MCVHPYLYCLWQNISSQILVLFSHHLIKWVHQSLCEWSQSPIPLSFIKPEGFCECERVYMCTVHVCACAYACVQVCVTNFFFFLSHPVLPRRNHPWLVLQHPEEDKWRGQQAAGEQLLSSAQQMGEAGQGIAVRFTFSSTHCNLPLRSRIIIKTLNSMAILTLPETE